MHEGVREPVVLDHLGHLAVAVLADVPHELEQAVYVLDVQAVLGLGLAALKQGLQLEAPSVDHHVALDVDGELIFEADHGPELPGRVVDVLGEDLLLGPVEELLLDLVLVGGYAVVLGVDGHLGDYVDVLALDVDVLVGRELGDEPGPLEEDELLLGDLGGQ